MDEQQRDFEEQLAPIEVHSPVIVEDAEDFGELGEMIVHARVVRRQVVEYHKPRKRRARKVWQDWVDQEKGILQRLDSFIDEAQSALDAWEQREERRREEEREKLVAAYEEATGGEAPELPAEQAVAPEVEGMEVQEVWTYEVVDPGKLREGFYSITPKRAEILRVVRQLGRRAEERVGGIKVTKKKIRKGVRR